MVKQYEGGGRGVGIGEIGVLDMFDIMGIVLPSMEKR